MVLNDELDPRLIAALHVQPADVGPIGALRRTVREVFAALSEEELRRELQRHELSRTAPELRARLLDQ